MQKFIEADYYELDWYYEECSDGNYDSSKRERGCAGPLSSSGGGGALEPSWGRRWKEGPQDQHYMALTVDKTWWRRRQVGRAGGQGS